MHLTDDTTYQAEVAAAAEARIEALFQLHQPGYAPTRAEYIRATDAIFAEYHKHLFAAIDGVKARHPRPKPEDYPGQSIGLPPFDGNPALN